MKWSENCSVVSDSLQPHVLYSPWNSLGQNTGVDSLSLLQGNSPTQGSNPGSSALQVDSLPVEPQGKPKNTGVGSLPLLQGIFPTQELKRSLLHCKRILRTHLMHLTFPGGGFPPWLPSANWSIALWSIFFRWASKGFDGEAEAADSQLQNNNTVILSH